MARRSDIDWEAIERDYLIDAMTDQQVADKHSVSRSALLRKAKKEGWTKDLSAQVKAETKAKVTAAIVEKATATLQESDRRNATAVDIAASSNAALIADHERTGLKGRVLFESILDSISERVASTATIAQIYEMIGEQDPDAAKELLKSNSLPSLVDAAKKAVEGASKSIDIERKARNLDDAAPDPSESITEVVRRLI